MECTYCHKILSHRSALIKHQKTVKMCIELQKELGLEIVKKDFLCSFCKKDFSSNHSLKYHFDHVCKTKKEHELSEMNQLSKSFVELKNKVETMESKINTNTNTTSNTTNTTNNNTMNNSNNTTNNISIVNYMTEERVLQIFKDHFGKNDLPEKKLADFTCKWFLSGGEDKPMYLCTDPSRKRFVFMDKDGEEVVDKNCSTLIGLLFQAKPYVKDLIQDEIIDQSEPEILLLKDQYKDFLNLEADGTEYKLQLCRRLPAKTTTTSNPTSSVDEIDWDINDKIKAMREKNAIRQNAAVQPKKHEETEENDPFGFF